MKQILRLAIYSFFCAAFLASQSLVELSKQEKERREKLKGKTARVVTNDDLKKIRRTAALSAVPSQTPPGESTQAAPPPTEPEKEAPPEEQEAIQTGLEAYQPYFATAVLPETFLVENPEFALNFPDGRFAQISIFGSLDLDFIAENGPGEDIAIYARRPRIADEPPENIEEGQLEGLDAATWLGDWRYAVMGMRDSGEWEAIGLGSGGTSQEKFDLGDIPAIKKIRIMFRIYTNPYNLGTKPFRLGTEEITFGLDAVEALN